MTGSQSNFLFFRGSVAFEVSLSISKPGARAALSHVGEAGVGKAGRTGTMHPNMTMRVAVLVLGVALGMTGASRLMPGCHT